FILPTSFPVDPYLDEREAHVGPRLYWCQPGKYRSSADSPAELLPRRRAGQAGLQAQDRLRVQLGDARLGHAQHLADLAQSQLFVVVERDDQLLALGQTRDRLAERFLQLRLRQLGLRLRSLRVLDRVDQGDLVAAGRGNRPQLVEGGDRRATDLGEALVELVGRDPELLGDLLVGRRAVELALELSDRPLDVAGPRANRARHPVEGAQLVDDRALDPRDRVRLELDVALGGEALDRPDQAEQPVRDEVVLVDVGGQPAAEPAGDVFDQRRVGEDQPV